ncbi:hypothetical protein [Variovorax sp. ZT4R33]|uniref:hypothetical protein n=1 Tax=Variovorax sp. ZT4R33 TaxID=3443743 RepID=UPI003F44640B
MALICVGCRTENRDAAKFCKGCGGKLVTLPTRSAEEEEALEDAWGATVLAPADDLALPSPSAPTRGRAHRPSRPSTLQTARAGLASRPDPLGARRAAPPDRSAAWVLSAAAAIVVLTGGWYGYRRATLPAAAAPASLSIPAPEAAALPLSVSPTGLSGAAAPAPSDDPPR